MTEPDDMKPFLEAVEQFIQRMAGGNGFEQKHVFDPNGPTTADVLRALDPQPRVDGYAVPPRLLRIIGRGDAPESYIPMSSPRSLEILKAIRAHDDRCDSLIRQGLTEERAKAKATRELDRVTSMGMAKARHDALARYTEHPTLSKLLTEHAPVEAVYGGRTYLECHTCPDYYDDDHGADVKAEWPCPTWTTIAEQTERAQ